MSTRAEHLAAQFEAAYDEIIALVTGCTDEQWRRPCVDEERSVGVVAHHVAETNQAFVRIVEVLAAGGTYTPRASLDEINQSNAREAQAAAIVSQLETLAALRATRAAMARLVRRLNDGDLDRVAGVFGGHELSVGRKIEWVVIGHAQEHLASLRATLVP